MFATISLFLAIANNTSREFSMTYQEILKRFFKDIPVIFNADIGHVSPRMTIINGAYTKIKAKNGKGKINFQLI